MAVSANRTSGQLLTPLRFPTFWASLPCAPSRPPKCGEDAHRTAAGTAAPLSAVKQSMNTSPWVFGDPASRRTRQGIVKINCNKLFPAESPPNRL